MCIPAASGNINNGYVREDRVKKHIKKVSKREFEKGDPNFVDERKTPSGTKEEEESFLASLFK